MRFWQEKPLLQDNSAEIAKFGRAPGNARTVSEHLFNVCIASESTIKSIRFIESKAGLVLISRHPGCGKSELSFTSATMVAHVRDNPGTHLIILEIIWMNSLIPLQTNMCIPKAIHGMVKIMTMISRLSQRMIRMASIMKLNYLIPP